MSDIILERYDGSDGISPSAVVDPAKFVRFNEVLTNESGRISLAIQAAQQGYSMPIAEGVSTSDFPILFGALIDRELLAGYQALVPDWRPYFKTGKVPNFNQHESHKIVGQDTILPQVAELAPYTEEPSTTGHYHRRVFKWGRKFSISFEAVINDSMGAFSDIAQRMITAAERTEAWNATQAFCSATGPSAALYGAPIADVDGQNVTNSGVLPFTGPNLAATLRLMSRQTDANGSLIKVRGVHVVVPVALWDDLEEILTSQFLQYVDTTGGANAVAPVYLGLPTQNMLPRKGLQPHVNEDLESIDVSANAAGTWYVFAEPARGASVQMDYLRGHEIPDVRMQTSNSTNVGGGPVGVMEGDFDNDGINYRLRCFHGAVPMDPRYTYAQVHV